MAAVSGKMLAVGTRWVQVFDIDAYGRPTGASAGTAAYAGLQAKGAKGFDVPMPDPRIIDFAGDDALVQRDMLPANQGVNMKLTLSRVSMELHELLTDIKAVTVGEAVGVRHGTDRDGFIPQVALHIYQQALDGSGVNRSRRWRSIFVPCTFVLPKAQGMGETPQDLECVVVPQVVTQELWGYTLVQATDGCTTMQFAEYMTEYRPKVVQWLQSGSSPVKLLFPTAYPAIATTKIHAFFKCTAGTPTDVLSAATKAVDGITPASAADGDVFVAFYEHAN